MLKNFIFALFVLLASAGYSEETTPLQAELTSDHHTIKAGQNFQLLLDLQLEEGWHAYWKNPGDAGIAPSIEWKLPEGLSVVKVDWPTPERFEMGDAITFGYSKSASFLVTIHTDHELKEQPLEISGEIQWIICSHETCLPGTTSIKANLHVGKSCGRQFEEKFHQVKKALPQDLPEKHLEQRGDCLFVSLPEEIAFNETAHFFPEEKQDYSKLPKVLADKQQIQIPLRSEEDSSLKGILVLGKKAYTVDFTSKASFPIETLSFTWAIAFAFIGGLILNLMPCVLPVISLKVMSFVKISNNSRKDLFFHGLSFTFGVLLSFWTLAALLIGMQATGQAVGWGFQLQDPIFIAALALLFTLLALNLFGVFELGTGFASKAGEAEAEKKNEGYRSSLWSGIFATAVATPCTGPFMGSALGYALTQPWIISFAVFTALGLGMSLPYLLIGLFPSLLRWLPKPGAWMESFKQFLGFVMLATVIWLLWVFNGQTSELGLFLLLFALLIASLAGWIYGRFGAPGKKKKIRNAGYLFSSLLVLATLSIAVQASLQVTPFDVKIENTLSSNSLAKWEPFSAEKVANLRKNKQPVLIDFTAKWCLICQANHLVMTNSEVVKKFTENGVTLMKADWTRYDPVITEALKKYGRSGVPLYVFYGANDEPVILPQVLTPKALIDAMESLPAKSEVAYVR